jgi:hypothetical protein
VRKYLLLSLLLWPTSAWAVCSTAAVQVKDNVAATPNMEITNGGGTNCVGEVALVEGGALIAAANALHVQPGTGATWAATQSGTWNITNVSGTVTLPTGASTAALQPTNAAQASTTSGQTGPLVQGAVTTAAPTYTTAQTDPLSLTTAGALRVDASAGGTVTVSGTVTANQGGAPWSQNVTQFGGVNLSTGTGASGTGIPRVTISNDSSLAANQSTNEAQINGVTPLMNNGVSGTGSQRVNIASDNSAVSGLGAGATGAAVPANAVQMGGNGSGNLTAPVVCDNWTPINNAGASTALKIITKVAAKQVYICSINLVAAAANNVALVEGTLTTNQCDTATAGLAGGATAATGWNLAANGGIAFGSGLGAVIRTATVNHDVCLLFSAANQVSGSVSWTQF